MTGARDLYCLAQASETAVRIISASRCVPGPAASRSANSYAGTPLDFETSFVRQFLQFVGIEEVEFVYAEGARDR